MNLKGTVCTLSPRAREQGKLALERIKLLATIKRMRRMGRDCTKEGARLDGVNIALENYKHGK